MLQKFKLSTQKRLQALRKEIPFEKMKQLAQMSPQPQNLFSVFETSKPVFFSEIKFQSPLLGKLRDPQSLDFMASEYLKAQTDVISVLTETDFFLGKTSYLSFLRQKHKNCFLFQKDFILHEYQVHQSRYLGANGFLLIAKLLTEKDLHHFVDVGFQLGLSPMIEVSNLDELHLAHQTKAWLIGVNNRNLNTLKINVEHSKKMVQNFQKGKKYISESGIENAGQVSELFHLGYDGFLVGTYLMKSSQPGQALRKLMDADFSSKKS